MVSIVNAFAFARDWLWVRCCFCCCCCFVVCFPVRWSHMAALSFPFSFACFALLSVPMEIERTHMRMAGILYQISNEDALYSVLINILLLRLLFFFRSLVATSTTAAAAASVINIPSDKNFELRKFLHLKFLKPNGCVSETRRRRRRRKKQQTKMGKSKNKDDIYAH